MAVPILAVAGLGMLSVWASMGDRVPLGRGTALTIDATLTAARPVAVRVLTVTTEPGPSRLTDAEVSFALHPLLGPDGWWWAYDPRTRESGAGFELPWSCLAAGCTGRYVLIARWMAPVQGLGLPVSFVARLSASGSIDAAPQPAQLHLAEDPAGRFDGDPPGVSAQAAGHARLAGSDPTVARQQLLSVPAVDLDGPLGFPLVGRAQVWLSDVTGSSDRALHAVGIRIAAAGRRGDGTGADWLAACAPGRDCQVPIDVTIWLDRTIADLAPSDWAEVTWTLDARLEFLAPGGARPPAPLSLRMVQPAPASPSGAP